MASQEKVHLPKGRGLLGPLVALGPLWPFLTPLESPSANRFIHTVLDLSKDKQSYVKKKNPFLTDRLEILFYINIGW